MVLVVFLVVLGFLVVLVSPWRFMVVFGGSCRFLMVLCGSLGFLVVLGGSWWSLVVLGGSFKIFNSFFKLLKTSCTTKATSVRITLIRSTPYNLLNKTLKF